LVSIGYLTIIKIINLHIMTLLAFFFAQKIMMKSISDYPGTTFYLGNDLFH